GGNLVDDGDNTFGADGAASDDALTYGAPVATLGGTAVDLSAYGALTIDEATGEWRFVLDNSLPATQALTDDDTIHVSFDYTLTDSDGDSKTGTVRFKILGKTNTPPEITPAEIVVSEEGLDNGIKGGGTTDEASA